MGEEKAEEKEEGERKQPDISLAVLRVNVYKYIYIYIYWGIMYSEVVVGEKENGSCLNLRQDGGLGRMGCWKRRGL